MGLLRVGPESAGSTPGPVCYGRRGEQPTMTDAAVVLGYIDPNFFLGGNMGLVADAARRAIADKVAVRLGCRSKRPRFHPRSHDREHGQCH